jgi:hypothetical protein
LHPAGATVWLSAVAAADGAGAGFGVDLPSPRAPEEDIVVLFTQRMMDSPEPPNVFTDFWTLAYGAME